jgi:hypothetical protein
MVLNSMTRNLSFQETNRSIEVVRQRQNEINVFGAGSRNRIFI